MEHTPDEQPEYTLGDRVEALVELAAEDPDFADWHNNYEGTLIAAGIDATSLSVVGRLAVQHIAGCAPTFIDGVLEIITAAHDAGYHEGYGDGIVDALATDEEDDLSP
jgi:hypothetical protein